ncbi:hypothetical protein AOQ84DRAFT_322351 [Glonium stellatum]|uniref:CorA-like transporter domain-containing protein n=1 Tax=Glonium stellatum TaxID=574774 RepID=A0A8E2JQG6_9PEZI|nr:hypothetical protein AOQ84DRAFT_322351 [Glonium stellatum]
MDSLVRSCEAFETYPQNLVNQTTSGYILKAYFARLKDQSDRMFHVESHASVDFLELHDGDEEFTTSCIEHTNRLKEQLREAFKPTRSDPRCRFMFMHSRTSHDPLRISYHMFTLGLTYHQVMPSFLDFVFPFGRQEHQQDSHFSGFRHDNSLNPLDRGLSVRELGRSGREIRLCYNLHSVEKSSVQAYLPWSIRQTAVYHSFDVETGRSLWINVKGNRLLKRRIEEAAKSSQLGSFKSIGRSFAATLITHMFFCEWAGENWRWYINDLEKELQDATGKTISTPADRRLSSVSEADRRMSSMSDVARQVLLLSEAADRQLAPLSEADRRLSSVSELTPLPMIPRTRQSLSMNHQETSSRPPSRPPSSSSQAKSTASEGSSVSKLQFSPFQGLHLEMPSSTIPSKLGNLLMKPSELQSSGKPQAIELDPGLPIEDSISQQESFSFSDLQRLQFIEERTHEALLVLKQNMTVLKELRQHYHAAGSTPDLPREIRSDCRMDFAKFENRVLAVERDLGMQQLRIEALMTLLADRKNLVSGFLYGILQYRTLQVSEAFTARAQISAQNLQAMATTMQAIVEKSKQESASMKIGSLATLLYMPGISIAVRTFMNKGITRLTTDSSGKPKRVFQLRGLKLYLAMGLPAMAATFGTWYIVHWVSA